MAQRLDILGGNDSSISEHQQTNAHSDLTSKDTVNHRKRKCLSNPKVKVADALSIPLKIKETNEAERNEKHYKVGESTKDKDDLKDKLEECNSAETAESCPKQTVDNVKPSSVPVKQDYIHVRARRGQATDSHSLAERVRREKISERMKLLQDLVPGCNKVTGKAVMLDEIINYVQALQCQVEFLSMKLAAVNPQMDYNVEGGYLTRDLQVLQPHCSSVSKMFAPETTATTSQINQLQKTPLQHGMQCRADRQEVAIRGMMDTQLTCMNGYADPTFQLQMSQGWDDVFQNVVDIGLDQNRSTSLKSHGFHGLLPTGHMKVEL